MPAGESEAGPLVVVESPDLPIHCVVTAAAARRPAQPALMVFVFMARRAAYALGGKALVGMAAGACDLGVLAQQGKARERVIETDIGFPTAAAVALSALVSELPGMDIVLRMASGTFHGELQFPRRANVAAFAADSGMFPGQGKARHAVVVEADLFPAAFGMAARAIPAVSALVHIVRGMTAITGNRRFGALRRLLVAGGASGKAVSALQRETSHAIMVKTRLLPRRGIVAGGTVRTPPPLMHIVVRMA